MRVHELVPEVLSAMSDKSRPTYARGIRLLDAELGGYELADVRLTDLERLRDRLQSEVGVATVKRARAVGRRLLAYDPDAHGKGAAENFVRAARFFFRYACKAGLLSQSPAIELKPPRRRRAPERPLTESELIQIWDVAVHTGKDPQLDELLLTFLRHTAARREGCLNLSLDQLHHDRRSITLTEKGGEARELPLAAWILVRLDSLARARGAVGPGSSVFRYRTGAPLTRRHFNALFDRIDRHLGWTEALDVATHWIRHTTLADIAAVSDIRVAAAFAGHAPGSLGVIGRYTQVTFEDLVAAYERVFGPRG
ncbi:site-specific recombinase XerD [Geodermatophilus bullaregiensis]|uniref:tyrosine-type recombinase/integrase n=1 Tax=Geodermatophilus bullaregiensis TaxID=1564160 RepID=UPI001956AE1D|nr:tyrosine-type recombinase/integrase [Geodermatophilus bullaregiensis]MBM7804199.1 site-specific recombinase XerD [Geodermatophilus bullaregiensis]